MKSRPPPLAPLPSEPKDFATLLRERFEGHPERHPGIQWADVVDRLGQVPEKWAAIAAMENTGGEPDVIGRDMDSGTIIFTDCSPETPKGRVSLCYDREALDTRKEHRPRTSALEMATAMGVNLLTEAEYVALQELGDFDRKTSSWILTPPTIRERGGALFGDRRYGRTFIYHNGAQSYFAARGFRAKLLV